MRAHTYIFFVAPIWQKLEPDFEMSQLKYNPPKQSEMQTTSAIRFTE